MQIILATGYWLRALAGGILTRHTVTYNLSVMYQMLICHVMIFWAKQIGPMAIWTKQIGDIDPNSLDTTFMMHPDGATGASDQLDAFAVVIRQSVPGSTPYPDQANRYLLGFSNICTHMGCRLAKAGARLDRDDFTGDLVCGPCPCHGTSFNLSKRGVVILGPASQHLPQLELTVSADHSVLTGKFVPASDDPTQEEWPRKQ